MLYVINVAHSNDTTFPVNPYLWSCYNKKLVTCMVIVMLMCNGMCVVLQPMMTITFYKPQSAFMGSSLSSFCNMDQQWSESGFFFHVEPAQCCQSCWPGLCYHCADCFNHWSIIISIQVISNALKVNCTLLVTLDQPGSMSQVAWPAHKHINNSCIFNTMSL